MAAAQGRLGGGRPARLTAEAFRRDGFGPAAAFGALVAEHDGAAIGYAAYCGAYDIDDATRGVCLVALHVRAEFRRRGVGRALLCGLAARERSNGARWMVWAVLRRNRAARRFYHSLARELGGVRLCAAFGGRFAALADAAGAAPDPVSAVRRPD